MVENLFKEFEKKISEMTNDLKSIGYQLETQSDENGVTIKLTKIDNKELKDEIKKFKDYVQQIDDDFFEKICDKFENESNISLNEFSRLMDKATDEVLIKDSINLFKELTKETVKEHIDSLVKSYLI